MSMRRSRLVAAALAAVLTLGAVATAVAIAPTGLHGVAHAAKPDKVAFHDAMRKLWEDHITWTRLFIVSAATLPDNLPDTGPTASRLLANQDDIADALRPFYGDEVGDAVRELLREHILIAADIITAAKAGDDGATTEAIDAWYVNANEIADALNGINPKHWPQDEMRAMMTAHLDRTLEEAVARLQGRYEDDIKAYEEIHADILQMADMLSDGIIAQFPDRFRG
jgi:hypothetical protein